MRPFLVLALLILFVRGQCEVDTRAAPNSDELVFVIELFRHGARGALSDYYDYNDQLFIAGQLTPTGMRQHFYLGNQLREEYILKEQFLSDTYQVDEISVLSTNVNRTIMSALSQIMGLYPLGTGPTLPDNLTSTQYLLPPYAGVKYTDQGRLALESGFSDLPVHNYVGPMLNPTSFCKNASKILSAWRAQPEQVAVNKQLDAQFSVTAQLFSAATGDANLTVSDLPYVYDVLVCDAYNGRAIPSAQITPAMWRNISFLKDIHQYQSMDCLQYRKIVNTVLARQWVDYLDKAAAGTSPLKWLMLSAHDTNIGYLLPFFNVSNTACIYDKYMNKSVAGVNCEPAPPFASSLILELRRDAQTQGLYVRLKYNGVYELLCESPTSTRCAYSEFRQRMLDSVYTLQDWNEVCGNSVSDDGKDDAPPLSAHSAPVWKVFLVTFQALTIAALTLHAHKLSKQYRNKNKSAQKNRDTHTLAQESVYSEYKEDASLSA